MNLQTCYTCKQEKPLEEFAIRKDVPRGRSYQCKACAYAYIKKWRSENPEKHIAQVRRWAKKNPERKRATNRAWVQNKRLDRDWAFADALRGNYGMTRAEYDAMHEAQSGQCAICKTTKARNRSGRLVVDHDHDTGRIRSLLCHRCNTGIGMFDENVTVLQAAIAYLEHHHPNQVKVAENADADSMRAPNEVFKRIVP